MHRAILPIFYSLFTLRHVVMSDSYSYEDASYEDALRKLPLLLHLTQ